MHPTVFKFSFLFLLKNVEFVDRFIKHFFIRTYLRPFLSIFTIFKQPLSCLIIPTDFYRFVNDKKEDIKVSVVNSFKLLGVTIDKKLNFTEHCSNLKKIINK